MNNYLYHYCPKRLYEKIKKNGMLSLYAQYTYDKETFDKNIAGYKTRVHTLIGKKETYTLKDYDKFFKSRGLDIRSIFFSFWKVIPGINKDRDHFIKSSYLIKIDIKSLERNWEYRIVNANKITSTNLNGIKKYSNMDGKQFQTKTTGKFLFTKIPHLAIITKDGRINKKYLIFDK